MIVEKGKYYLYRHIRLDTNQPFYIGIGTKITRYKKYLTVKSEYERGYSKSNRNKFWKNIVNKTKYRIDILLESDDYRFIEQKEKEFVSIYGRRNLGLGELTNLTNGGDGCTGHKWDKESRQKLSLQKKGKFFSMKSIEKMKIPVIEYDIEGNFIKIWKSLADAARFHNCRTGHISKCCKFEIHKIKNRQFRYWIENYEKNIGTVKGRKKPIYQYNSLSGEFIKMWNSNIEIGKFYNIQRYKVDYFVKEEQIFNNFIFSNLKTNKISTENRKQYKQKTRKIK